MKTAEDRQFSQPVRTSADEFPLFERLCSAEQRRQVSVIATGKGLLEEEFTISRAFVLASRLAWSESALGVTWWKSFCLSKHRRDGLGRLLFLTTVPCGKTKIPTVFSGPRPALTCCSLPLACCVPKKFQPGFTPRSCFCHGASLPKARKCLQVCFSLRQLGEKLEKNCRRVRGGACTWLEVLSLVWERYCALCDITRG